MRDSPTGFSTAGCALLLTAVHEFWISYIGNLENRSTLVSVAPEIGMNERLTYRILNSRMCDCSRPFVSFGFQTSGFWKIEVPWWVLNLK
jgi:hypothetical protein